MTGVPTLRWETFNTPLEAVLSYADQGWSIVPARVTGKRTLVAWKPFQEAAADREQLRSWWRRWPKANPAVVTGRVSGVLVVDVDPRHGGDHALAELERRQGTLSRTAVVATPSGGVHLYLAHPGGHIPNSASRLGPGLDVRGDGGLALLPPSRRPDGGYCWTTGGPGGVPPPCPDWLAELLRPTPRPRPPAPTRPSPANNGSRHLARFHGLLDLLADAPNGERNCRLYWASCRLGELLTDGAPPAWVELLVRAGTAAGLGEQEARGTVASGLTAATRP
jgi:hypothetical protein